MLEPLLKTCWRIEEIAAEIYHHLGANARLPDPMRQTFLTLARDELGHADQLDQALRMRLDMPQAQKSIAWTKVEEALQLALELQHSARTSPGDADVSLQLAIRLEKNFLKVHLDNAVFFEDERVAALFRGLARSDQEHLQTLTDCLRWWRQGGAPP